MLKLQFNHIFPIIIIIISFLSHLIILSPLSIRRRSKFHISHLFSKTNWSSRTKHGRNVHLVLIQNCTWFPELIMLSDWLKFKNAPQKPLAISDYYIVEMYIRWSCTSFGFWIPIVNTRCPPQRRVWRYQRGNQNPYIEKEQTTQWPKEKVQKDKQRSTKHTFKTTDRVTRTPLKTGGKQFPLH
jgi:hypothetical protein